MTRKGNEQLVTGHDNRDDENPPSKSNRCKEAKCVDFGFPHTADNKVMISTGKLAADNKSRASSGEIPSNELAAGGSGSDFRTDAQCQGHVCWKGNFEVFDIASHVYNGIQAHISVKASHKASEVSKQMPEELKFKMVPRKAVWPKIFQFDSPDKDDIGLYFVPRDEERPREMYDLLLKWVDSHDFAMQSHVNDVELLIFTSKQLSDESQKIDPRPYLWGIFRKVTHKKSSQHVPEHLLLESAGAAMANNNCNPSILVEGNSEDVDMEVDMVGGAEVGRIDKPIPRLSTPTTFVKFPLKPGYSKPPSPLKNVGNTTVLDASPGFSRPPSPVKVCSTDMLDTPPGFCGPPSLLKNVGSTVVLDAPPGFSGPPSLLKNEGSTVVLDAPPGFSRPPSHLKHVGSTAVLDTSLGFSRPPSPFQYPLKKEGSIGVLDGPPGFSGQASYRHGITPLNTTMTSGLTCRSTTGGYPEASVLQSRYPQVVTTHKQSAKHYGSNSNRSPCKEGVIPVMNRPSSANETKPQLLSTNVLSPSSTEKWLCVEALQERKNEIKKKLAAVNEKACPSLVDKLLPSEALQERKNEIKRKLAAINEKTPWLSVSIKTEL